jgi:murein DD-endopeptidase MepM/ murein hydrolase activator NlpD
MEASIMSRTQNLCAGLVLALLFAVSACSPTAQTPIPTVVAIATNTIAPTAISTPQPTDTPISIPTATPAFTFTPTNTNTPKPIPPTRTRTPTNTPTLYNYHNIGFPLGVDDVVAFVKNYGCPTTYGDNTHDGNDIFVVNNREVPVMAVDDGRIAFAKFLGDQIGYEIRLVVGQDGSGKNVAIHYVHLTKSSVSNNQKVKKGDIIGYIGKPLGDEYRHLHFEVRIGDTPRHETESDDAPGDEVNVTEILIKFVPAQKVYDKCGGP